MSRACSDCGVAISARSSGRCRPCAMREVSTREAYKNRARPKVICFTAAQIDRMRRLVDQYGVTVAAEILHTSTAAISRVKRRGWTVADRSAPKRPIPSDFAIQADSMTLHQLARHYRAGVTTVSRWAREIGRERMCAASRRRLVLPPNILALVAKHGIEATAAMVPCHPDTLRRKVRAIERAMATPTRGIGWAERMAA